MQLRCWTLNRKLLSCIDVVMKGFASAGGLVKFSKYKQVHGSEAEEPKGWEV